MNPKDYALIGLVGLMLVTGTTLKAAWQKNGELKAELTESYTQLNQAADANEAAQDAIALMQANIEQMVAQRAAEARENERILAERAAELQAAIARADALERERRDEITLNDDCRALAELDVVRFCPTIASQLLWRSQGQSGDRGPDGPSAG